MFEWGVGMTSRSHASGVSRFSFRFLTLILTMWSADAVAGPMTFRLASDGGPTPHLWIVADGDITSDTPDRFREFLLAGNIRRGSPLDVYLHSNGGNLFGGDALGGLILDHGFGASDASPIPRHAGLPSRLDADAP